MALKVFVDSDVAISSLISPTGAAFLLLNQTDDLDLFISNISLKELENVAERLHLEQEKLKTLTATRFSIVHLPDTREEVKTTFSDFVLDRDDSHIVAGATKAEVQFLITYNTRHFKADKVRTDFTIILATPANFLQYLRSL